MEKQGPISSNDLMLKLVAAKKVMNKVDSGNYQKGLINETKINSSTEELIVDEKPSQGKTLNSLTNEEKVKQSKLPDAIKKAMIDKPIQQISLNDKIDMDLFAGAKKLMEREGMTKRTIS